jgi:hypothetical protein
VVFGKSVKPYRKFFRGTDLWLNHGCEDKKVDVQRGIWRLGAPALPQFHLRPLASPKSDEGGSAVKKGMIMKTRHGKIAQLPKEIREPLNHRLENGWRGARVGELVERVASGQGGAAGAIPRARDQRGGRLQVSESSESKR